MPPTNRLRKNLSAPKTGRSINTASNNNNSTIVELPLLESVSDIISQASYFSVAPLIDPETQSKLARRALKLKSSSNARVSNATYSSLFFDPAAHVPISEEIIEGDAQSLLFTFQRSRSLFQKLHQTFVIFSTSVNLDSLLMMTNTNEKKVVIVEQTEKEAGTQKNNNNNHDGGKNAEKILGLVQIFQQCAFELWQIMSHARTTLCKMPLLLAGTSDTTHMLLEVKDWAIQIKETLNQIVEEELKKSKKETNLENIHPDILELSHKCTKLLFSDAIWTPTSLRREIEKAEKSILNDEIIYISNSFKDLVKKWNSNNNNKNSNNKIQTKYRCVQLLSCYGNVIEQQDGKTMFQQQNQNEESENQQHQKDDDDEVEKQQIEEILRDLQLSLQRIQLFTGEREAITTTKATATTNNTSNNITTTSTITTSNNNKSNLLNDSSTTHHSKIVFNSVFFSPQNLPQHILTSHKFQAASLTDKMQVVITFQTLRTIFLGKWKKWLKMKKQKHARVDNIMRKNAALHCLWRFQVWKQQQEAARAARRATYGTRGMRYGVEGQGEGFVAGTMTKSTQTLGPEHNAPRFFLKIVQ
jgi:hypothetical protein